MHYLLLLSLLQPSGLAMPTAAYGSCSPVTGTFTLDAYQLFPESAEWDPISCKLWVCALYNASELIYDPYTKSSATFLLPGISGSSDFHAGGIKFGPRTESMLLVADDATAFASNTSGFTLANLTGPNRLLKYDLRNARFAYDVSMSDVQDRIFAETGNYAAGFQDACFDANGNAYMVGSFGSVIARVTPSGDTVSLWYRPNPYQSEQYGFTGLFSVGQKLVVSDTISQGLVTFETDTDTGLPTYITPEKLPDNYTLTPDGLHAPFRYSGRVALMADDHGYGLNLKSTGGVAVFGSLDGWNTVQYLGFVSNQYQITGVTTTTSTVQIVDTIYLVSEYFQRSTLLANKTAFPFVDITEQVDQFVTAWEATV